MLVNTTLLAALILYDLILGGLHVLVAQIKNVSEN